MTDPLDLLHVHASERSAGSDAGTAAAEAGHAVDVLEGDLVPGDTVADRESLSMLVTWSGHTDAGSLSDQLSGTLLSTLPHRRLASFAVDELYDYRSRRPQVTFSQGRFSDYEPPELSLYEVRDALGRPFLMLTGDEPDFRWEQVSETVLELVDRLDVRLVVHVDALGLPVPHTRALGVTAHGTRNDLISGISTWSPDAQIEAGLSQVLEMRLAERGRDVVGYSLHVPHYLAGGRYPQVAVAGLEYAGAAMELMLPTDDLRESARSVEQDISRQVDQNSEVQGMVERLERNFDAHATAAPRSLLVKSDEEVPDAEELGEAVEAYLATRPADPAIDEARRREADGGPGSADGAEDGAEDSTDGDGGDRDEDAGGAARAGGAAGAGALPVLFGDEVFGYEVFGEEALGDELFEAIEDDGADGDGDGEDRIEGGDGSPEGDGNPSDRGDEGR